MDPTGGIQQIPSKKQFDFGGTIQKKQWFPSSPLSLGFQTPGIGGILDSRPPKTYQKLTFSTGNLED